MPSKGLPEIVIDSGPIAEMVARIQEKNLEIARLSAEVATARNNIIEHAKNLRNQKADEGEFIGLIRINAPGYGPAQVQFQSRGMEFGVEKEPLFDDYLGAYKDEMLERIEELAEKPIDDLEAFINLLKEKGLDPKDFIANIKTKKPKTLQKKLPEHFTKTEVIVPKKGFLTKLNEISSKISQEARAYFKARLDEVLVPAFDAGNKPTGNNPVQ